MFGTSLQCYAVFNNHVLEEYLMTWENTEARKLGGSWLRHLYIRGFNFFIRMLQLCACVSVILVGIPCVVSSLDLYHHGQISAT